MVESSEDLISNLPESVVCHILSRLPTNDAVRTSVLSKEWKHKWTSSYNIQLCGHTTPFNADMRERFRCRNDNFFDPYPPKEWINDVLRRGGIQSFEMSSDRYQSLTTFAEGLYNCMSLTKLKLSFNCILIASRMKNCFPNLKILCLGHRVGVSNDEVSNSGDVVLNFPVLEELELRCFWGYVKFVEINAPELIRLLLEGQRNSFRKDFAIKIDGPKLTKFETCSGLHENVLLTAPSVSNAVLSSYSGNTVMGFRARAILQAFRALEYLKLSSGIVRALTDLNVDSLLPCFNRLKKLELDDNISDAALLKLIQVMPSLESLILSVYDDWPEERLKYFPSGNASLLKEVKLVGFRGTRRQTQLVKSVLKNVGCLEKLIISVCRTPLMSNTKIKRLLATSPRSSTCTSVEVEPSIYVQT